MAIVLNGSNISRSKNLDNESYLSIDTLLDCRCLMALQNPLTRAEYEVATSFIRGLSYGEIAQLRDVSQDTVKSQITRLLSKTDSRHRFELLMRVLESNLTAWSTRSSTSHCQR